MRTKSPLLTALSAVVLLLGACATAANAADAILPARASISDFSIGDLRDRPAHYPLSSDSKWKKQWAISLAPLFVSESLDAASSYGMRELNPLLAGADGGFGMKAAGMKFGVIGALAGVEYILVKKYPHSAKFFSIVNWTTAGATAGLAVHNFELPR
jgi:hypothetical protein